MLLPVFLAFADVASALTYYSNDTHVPRNVSGGYVLRGPGIASSEAVVSSGTLPSATGSTGPAPRLSNASLSSASSVSTVHFWADVFSASIDWPRPTAVPHATQCWSDIASWSSSSISWYNAHVAGRSWPVTSSTSIVQLQTSKAHTYYPTDTSTYKLCDGSARVNVRPSSTTTYFNSTSGTYTRTYLATPTFRPKPCNPTPQDCHIWHNKSSIPQFNEDSLIDLCGNPSHGVDQPCVFGIDGAVELIYFPVKLANANASLCSGNASTITASPTGDGPNAITTLGRTFTSGAVYMSIKALSAYVDGFNYLVGPSFSNLILTLSTSDVSSQCNGNKVATSLNFADLNWPVPASAYNCQNRCGYYHIQDSVTPKECSTIWSDVNPLLAIPTQITELSPLWATCAFEVPSLANYWFDPPIALQEQQVPAVPTFSPAPTPITTPAAPSSRLQDPTPSNTAPKQSATGASTSSSIEQATETLVPFSPIGADSSTTDSGATRTETVKSDAATTFSDVTLSKTAVNDPVASPSSASGQNGISPDAESSAAVSVLPPAVSILTEALSSVQTSLPSISGGQDLTSDVATSGSPVKASPSGLIAESHTMQTSGFDQGNDTPATTVAGAEGFTITFSAIAGNSQAAVVGSQTIAAGSPAVTISDHVITHGSDGIALISQSETMAFIPVLLPTPSTFAAGSLTLMASSVAGDPDAVALDGTTISAGGPAATISGKVVSKGSSDLLLHGSRTVAFTHITGTSDVPKGSALQEDSPTGIVIAADSFTVTASLPSGSHAVAIDGTTLFRNGPGLTTAGRTITYGSSGLLLAGAETTAAFSAVQTSITDHENFGSGKTTWALGSLTFTAAAVTDQPNAISIHGTTLSKGGSAAVINHVTLSMGSSGLELVKPLTRGRGSTLPAIVDLNSAPAFSSTLTTSSPVISATQPPDAIATSSGSSAGASLRRGNKLVISLLGCWTLCIALIR